MDLILVHIDMGLEGSFHCRLLMGRIFSVMTALSVTIEFKDLLFQLLSLKIGCE